MITIKTVTRSAVAVGLAVSALAASGTAFAAPEPSSPAVGQHVPLVGPTLCQLGILLCAAPEGEQAPQGEEAPEGEQAPQGEEAPEPN
ncbi:hypothetical protein [Streptomyces sp. AC627_RSS907]|uniref:hypothetical protein n=1 Tax=Streptomyces sp. AC627_RSS907 TaxID=2823684 RepID=UPI001C264F4B|nr:hypothetical protein [Streptomyces sp. AC627_RSS907]